MGMKGLFRRQSYQLLPLSILFMLIGMTVQATPNPNVFAEECRGCHGMPLGRGQDNARFKMGAHAEHATIVCDQCHTTGAADDHVNGVISLRSEIEYQYGSEVPWPSMGGGSCGGLDHPFQLTGCHEQRSTAKCVWSPGKNCRSEEGS